MINKIIDGISEAINSEFGDTYNIFTESVEQGLVEPCFSILCLNPTNNLFRGKRYYRENKFCIHYFPSTDEKNIECNSVLERLYNCLERITVDEDLVNGTNMNSEIVDGVLNFFINYNIFVYKQESTITMNHYDAETEVN